MTDIPTPDPAEDDDGHLLAGEYVLGVLDAPQRAAVRQRIVDDAVFAGAVDWWERSLTPLVGEVAAAEPSAGLWTQISNLIASRSRPSLWRDVRVWRGVSVGALALAAACVVGMVVVSQAPPPAVVAPLPNQVAVIADPATREARLVATLDRANGQLVLTPVALTLPEGRDPELWIIPQGGKPISLGVIATSGPTRMAAPVDLRTGDVFAATLAISDEPLGGSPTGAPTGSIRAAGQFIRT